MIDLLFTDRWMPGTIRLELVAERWAGIHIALASSYSGIRTHPNLAVTGGEDLARAVDEASWLRRPRRTAGGLEASPLRPFIIHTGPGPSGDA